MQCSLSAQISCASEVCFALWTGQPVQKNESDVKAQRRLPLQCQVRNHVRKGCSKLQSTKSLNSGSLNPCMYMHGFTLVYIPPPRHQKGEIQNFKPSTPLTISINTLGGFALPNTGSPWAKSDGGREPHGPAPPTVCKENPMVWTTPLEHAF